MRRVLAGVWLAAAVLAAQSLKIEEHILANGMKVLIHEDHDVPSVAMYYFYKVGSRNERPGTTGISHYFEHMMFNGAKKYGPKQFDIQMEKAGGRNNAYTTRDVTVYTDWFPPSALELMFDMEADRIRDLSFDPKIVESERGVVYSERRSGVDNNPFGALYEQLNATAFVAHPYQFPVIGWPSDIESWSMEDLKAHFKMGYAPNNCVLVITGDVKPAEALALARKYLEPIPRQEPPPPVRTKEPEQQGERRVELRRAAALPILLLSYHVPETRNPEYPALQLMTTILSGGRSSRLTRRLVDQEQIALNVNMSAQQSLDPGQILVSLQVRGGKDPKQAEKLLYEEFERLGRDGVTAEELEKAKNQILAEYFRGLRTIAGKANLIGNYEVFHGGWQNLAETEKRVRAVSAEQVKAVAAKYLTAKNRTVGTLVPETSSRKEVRP